MICELDKEHGFWLLDDRDSTEHRYDPRLSDALADYLHPMGAVADLGCGFGKYVRNFRTKGIVCDGYDGNPHTKQMTDGECDVADLTKILIPNREYDFVLSLEVAEHIPEKYEGMFLRNIHGNNKRGVVLSWGLPGQRGWGHVNCRSNEYVKGIFVDLLGYTNDIETETKLRETAELEWFKKTIMVFRR